MYAFEPSGVPAGGVSERTTSQLSARASIHLDILGPRQPWRWERTPLQRRWMMQESDDTIRLGKYDIGIAVGMDKHPRGSFTFDPAIIGLPAWYGETGQYLTTKFFGMKVNRYMHDHGVSVLTLGARRSDVTIAVFAEDVRRASTSKS